MNIVNLYENYNNYFDTNSKSIFELVSKIAQKSEYKIYLIGGIVRDLILNKQSLDIDITVEGDAIEFANILEREGAAKIVSVHKDFGTVKIEIQSGDLCEKIDLASTRSETYPKKGHLPSVAEIGCSLEKDVLRRDFTINSLALSLNQTSFADLIDYVDGFEDLRARKIRILHDKSFIDDPTRIIRALKYSTRLGFELDSKTLGLQQDYLAHINYDMCNKRVKNELKKTFEQNSQVAFNRFVEQKIYKLVTKLDIEIPEINIEELINNYKPKHPWIVYFGVIGVFEEEALFERLELSKFEKMIILEAKKIFNLSLETDLDIYMTFCLQKIETILILAILGKEKNVFHYLNHLQHIKLSITGKDILALGFEPSKDFSSALNFVLEEKLKNPKMKKTEELEKIKQYFFTIC